MSAIRRGAELREFSLDELRAAGRVIEERPHREPHPTLRAVGGYSHLEESLEQALALAKVRPWVREHRFHTVRRWRFDFAWPDEMLAVEAEGGLHNQGRHLREYGKDCEKYNEATLAGWRVLRVTAEQIHDGSALEWIERALS